MVGKLVESGVMVVEAASSLSTNQEESEPRFKSSLVLPQTTRMLHGPDLCNFLATPTHPYTQWGAHKRKDRNSTSRAEREEKRESS